MATQILSLSQPCGNRAMVNVRFAPESGHLEAALACLLWAKNRHCLTTQCYLNEVVSG
jgi:hypothetical protein